MTSLVRAPAPRRAARSFGYQPDSGGRRPDRASFSRRALPAMAAVCVLACASICGPMCGSSPAGDVGVPRAAAPGTSAPSFEAPAAEAGGGRVFIDDLERPLGDVLDYLSRVGEYSIIVLDDGIRGIRVRARMDNVYWRDALDVIALKYNLEVSEKARARVLTIDRPKPISMTFEDGDVRKVITAIAKQANANVVMGETVQGRVTFHLTEVPWRDALEIVARAARCVVVPERRNVIRVALPQELEAQMETRVFQLAYIQPGGSRYRAKIKSDFAERVETRTGRPGGGQMSLQEVLDSVKSPKGNVATLRGTNSLIVTDTQQKLEVMDRLVNQLDRPPKQVHLSIKLIELTDSDAEEVGILWQNGLIAEASGMSFATMFPFSPGSTAEPFAGTVPGNIGVTLSQQTPSPTSPISTGETLGGPDWTYDAAMDVGAVQFGTLDFTKLTALLKFIKTETSGRVIQAPQLIALDHEEATIHVGELVRYAESFVSTTEGGGTASGFKEAANSPVNLGIQVLVIPHVTGPDNNVILTVIPKTEAAQGAQLFEIFEGGALGTLKLPQTVQRTVVTKMMLRDRETGIIAGLRQVMEGETVTKIPFLGDIPIIGWLFRHRSRPAQTNKSTNLLILITPTVIDFERKVDIEDIIRRSQEELGGEFSLEEEILPRLVPGAGVVPAEPTVP